MVLARSVENESRKEKTDPKPKASSNSNEAASWPGFSRHEQCPLQMEMRKAPLMCINPLPCNIVQLSRRLSRQKTENRKTHKHWSSCLKCHGLAGIFIWDKLGSHVLEWNVPVPMPHRGSHGHQWELSFYDNIYPQRTLGHRVVRSLRLTLLSKMGLNPI